MGIRHRQDEESNGPTGDRLPRGNVDFDVEKDRGIDGRGLTARWQARLRLQREQRSGLKDRRTQPRAEQGTSDRRLAV